MELIKPELLSPAGDFDRLYAAVKYGADAVYLGSSAFGMRTAAASFGGDKLIQAVNIAHASGVKVYLTCNTLPHNDDMEHLPAFLDEVALARVDALIVSDIGVLNAIKKRLPNMEIHISTQAGIVNYATACAYHDMGAKRVVLARELSLDEIATLRAKTPSELEIECFVHGAMCVSFSGRCLLSNYICGRDSNRGDCSQPCRWKYSLVEEKRPGLYFPIEQDDSGTYILNSKDMCLVEHIPELVNAGISSFKIEGRAKSEYYTAVVTNAYRNAIDGYFANTTPEYKTEQWIIDELRKISYREYCTGFFFDSPHDDACISYKGGYLRPWDVCAVVDGYADGRLYCTQRNRFFEGEEVEILSAEEKPFKVKAVDLRNEENEPIDSTKHAMMKFSFKCEHAAKAGSFLRIQREEI